MDFDNPKVYGDTSITEGLVWLKKKLPQETFAKDTLGEVAKNAILVDHVH